MGAAETERHQIWCPPWPVPSQPRATTHAIAETHHELVQPTPVCQGSIPAGLRPRERTEQIAELKGFDILIAGGSGA
jgi:hypothetical protein